MAAMIAAIGHESLAHARLNGSHDVFFESFFDLFSEPLLDPFS
jgi:hypothetical protein